jgi:hypothetical protein
MGGLGADAAEQGVDDPGGEGVGVLAGCRVLTGLVLPSMRALLIEKPQPILTRRTFAVA